MTPSNPEKTSRQRKVYAAILALALGGLAVDRLVLGGATGPKDASAEVDAAASPDSPKSPLLRLSAGPSITTRANTLAGRLDRMAGEQQLELLTVEDAFRPALGWVRPAETGVKPIVQLTEGQAFAKSHRLMAVINNNGGAGAAIIDNQTLTVGRQIDGYTLVSVTQRSALLEKAGQRVELTLPDRKTTQLPAD
jgi:hypothetical protein